ncbi:hypothetical protein [Sinorhizobium mexicanum]|uniref:Uncharacterized protein n=1 Tax=Sinorhizobium mexicanum TaxID=375549 RepID=A0A859QIV0_9HYPH|nr:hypothetical protein [Sinorhizobium mexicanum]MBP1883968.1 hypothetical protein [Sinorhizobium mexicanum]QLL64694.1 hypothetical protein FKV68_25140 [Sinorhizobium mexicanum]
MRRRSKVDRVPMGSEGAPAPLGTPIGWDDLSSEEKTALKRINRGPDHVISQSVGERLIALGLAVERPHGIGISRQGRELVIAVLLRAREGSGTELDDSQS